MSFLTDNVVFLVLALLTVDGLHFVFARALHDYMNPTTSVMYVLLCGTLEVGVYAAAKGQLKLSTFRNNFWFFLSIGLLVAVSTGINYFVVGLIEPGVAALLSETSILFGVALGVWWLKDKLTRQQLIGAGVAVVGVVIIAFQPGDFLRLGAFLVIGSALMYALHAALVKRYGGKIAFVEFFFWRLAATTGFLMISAGFQGLMTPPTAWQAWLIILIAGSVDISISRTLYYLALRKLSVSIHSLVLTLSPVVAIIWSFVLFGDTPGLRDVVGGLAVLAGIAIVTYRRAEPANVDPLKPEA